MACDIVIDSYSESNQDGYKSLNAVGDLCGQAFAMGGTARDICGCKFYTMNNFDVGETTSIQARIYACTGTPGTDGAVTGSVLASSTTVDLTYTDAEAGYSLKTFTFPTSYTLAASTNYILCLYCTAISDAASYVRAGFDSSSPSHAGNYCSESSANNTIDTCFYAYYDDSTGWTGKINGVTNPTRINGILVANITSVNEI